MLAEEDADEKVNPTYAEVRLFLEDKGRSQVFREYDEWGGRIRKPLGPGISFAIDDLDWRTIAPKREQPGYKEQEGYLYMLCCLDRGTRMFYVRPLKTKRSGETVAALRSILQEANATDTIKEISFDSASEFLSADMRDFLARLGPNENGVTVHVKPPGRESRQDIADLDSKMGIFSRHLMTIRKQAEPETLAWKPFILSLIHI